MMVGVIVVHCADVQKWEIDETSAAVLLLLQWLSFTMTHSLSHSMIVGANYYTLFQTNIHNNKVDKGACGLGGWKQSRQSKWHLDFTQWTI
jgi:hypothetical protein